MIVGNDYKEYIYDLGKKTNENTTNKPKNDLDKDAFLRLLTTQLSNQDPLNPIEDREFIAQLAQFSSLEQMQNLNKSLIDKSNENHETLKLMNKNQIEANVEILKELINIKKAMNAYLGKEPVKPEPNENKDNGEDNAIQD